MTGFRVFNENGSEQVGNQAYSLALSYADNVTLTDDGGIHPQAMVSASVSVIGTNPIFSFLPGEIPINVDRVNIVGSTFTFHLKARSSNPINIPFWIFDVPVRGTKQPGLSTAGLKVYDQFGTLTFDAADSVFRIVGYLAPSMPNPTAPGRNQLYESVSSITVPTGRVYAVIQSLNGFANTMWSTRQYAENPGGAIEIPGEIDPGLPPPNARYKYMYLESYYSAASKSGPIISAGLRQFEQWDGWYAINETEHVDTYGQLGYTVIDVTDFIGGQTSNPATVNVTVSPTAGSASGAAGSTTISNIVTASASGGTGTGYSYLWEYIGGSTTVVPYSGTNSSTFRTQLSNQPAGSTFSATWRVKVTDSGGNVGVSQSITFTHSAASEDRIPDNITLPTMNVSSPEHDVFWDTLNYGTYTVTGINQPITLRFERYDYSGNMDALYVDVYTKPPGGSWTHHGYYFAHSPGLRYIDVPNVVNGTEIRYTPHGITDSGRRTATCRFSLWALESNVQFGQSAMCNFVVDSDDNYNNADYEPDPIFVPELKLLTNDPSGWTNTGELTISGINKPIVLRFTRGNQLDLGGIFTRRLYIYHSNNSGVSWTEYFVGAGAVSQADITVNNGDWIHIRAYMDTSAGRGETSFTGYITNVTSGGTLLASYAISGVVDADNDYNIGEYTPDPFSFGDASEVTNDPSGTVGVVSRQITGINRTVTLRVERFNYSGNLTTANTYVYRGPGPSGPWTKVADIDSRGSATRYVDFTVNNGDWIYYYAYGDTSSGRKTGQWDIVFWNESIGHVSITSGRLSLTVDNDDNYNIGDYSMNPMDFNNIRFDTTDNSYYTYNNYRTVSGINRPVTVSVQIANFNVSGPIQNSLFACQSQRGDLMTMQLLNTTSYMTVQNGDSIRFAVVVGTTGGRRSFSFDVYITNQDTGEFIDHHHVSGFFGSNPPTVSVNNTYISNSFFTDARIDFQSYTNTGDVTLTVNGGVGTKTIVWERYGSSWGSDWSYSGTTQPTFHYYGRTNYTAETMARAKVTDQAGNVAYSEWVTIILTAGDQRF